MSITPAAPWPGTMISNPGPTTLWQKSHCGGHHCRLEPLYSPVMANFRSIRLYNIQRPTWLDLYCDHRQPIATGCAITYHHHLWMGPHRGGFCAGCRNFVYKWNGDRYNYGNYYWFDVSSDIGPHLCHYMSCGLWYTCTYYTTSVYMQKHPEQPWWLKEASVLQHPVQP